MSAVMKMLACARLVKERLGPRDIVVCGLGATEAAFREAGPIGPTYFASDPMGIWTSVAIGLAIARADRRVVLLAGDGDLAMNLQALVTAAAVAPANLRIVVFQNGTYASTGGQTLANADTLSLATIAKGAGIAWTAEAREEREAARLLDALFGLRELGLLAVHLDGEPSPYFPPGPLSQVEERTLFMRSLNETD
jgi:thiamine pyrophosphate-dependent acetolactate synthase large subunit-like protein